MEVAGILSHLGIFSGVIIFRLGVDRFDYWRYEIKIAKVKMERTTFVGRRDRMKLGDKMMKMCNDLLNYQRFVNIT